MVAAVVEEQAPDTGPVTDWLRDVLDGLGGEFGACRQREPADAGELIDQIALLEQIQAAAAAVRAAKIVRFAQAQVAAQHGDDWDPAKVGQGIAEQVALACHVSPSEGSRRLGRARALWYDLPATLELMAHGRLSEWAAMQVVTETRHLDPATRRDVARRLVADDHIEALGVRAVSLRARARAYAADPVGYTERGRTERKHRRVGIRPAPDTMSWLSAYLAVEQGVACWAALRRATDAAKGCGDPRTRDQIMADTLVTRLTGQRSADAVSFDLRLTDQGDGAGPGDPEPHGTGPGDPEPHGTWPGDPEPHGAWPHGHRSGPDSSPPGSSGADGEAVGGEGSGVAAGHAAGTTLGAHPAPPTPGQADPQAALTLPQTAKNRLDTEGAHTPAVRLLVPWVTLAGGDRPGVLVGHGPIPAPLIRELLATATGRVQVTAQPPDPGQVSRSRTFRGKLKQQIEQRDQTCRDPYCDAPIRHIDHVRRWADGGTTSYLNGRGVCERGNYLRELPGWTVRLTDPDTHTIRITTPTGHTYTSKPAQPP